MTKSVPPNVVLPLPTKTGMFRLSPEKTVGALATKIQKMDGQIKSITIIDIDGSEFNQDTKLDVIASQSFWINVNNNRIRIFPSVVQMMSGGFNYVQLSQELGVARTEAMSICRWIDDMEKQLPETFDSI